ncbi:hypothetical protein [Variovorax sp. KK3]|uniref:hypothetical protein n=1 Tax=Variovorax sp. KK3 TaxID=1855728 RepID=UPI00097C592E|nr:hypothetical protein [Variovorax sp. KK3]
MYDQDTQPMVLGPRSPARDADTAEPTDEPSFTSLRSIASAWSVFVVVLLILLSFAAACVVYGL